MALIFLDMFACKSIQKSASFQEAGQNSRNVGEFPWQWISEEAFIAQVLTPRVGAVTSRPATDPSRLNLQAQLDQLDHFMREKNPDGLRNVPKPQIFLWENASPQAYVAKMDVCLSKTGQLPDAEGASEDFLGIDRELLGMFRSSGPRPCVKISYQGAALQAFMDWYLKPFPGCQARVTSRATLFSPACVRASIEGVNMPAHTRDVFVRLSSNWIVVTTGIFNNLSEGEAVATVFHEAGHYYAAHLSQPRALAAGEDPQLQELSEELLYWLKAKEVGTRKIHEGAPGQRFHSGLYLIARNGIQDWMRKEGARTACKDLSQHFLTAQGLEHFPWELSDARGQDSYRVYEEKVERCLANLELDAAMQTRMLNFIEGVAPWSARVLPEVPRFSKALDLWQWMNGVLPEILAAPDRRVAELSKKADDRELGPDTREQEADQRAIAWMRHFGIDPQHGVTAALKQLQIVPPHTGAFTYEQCARAYAAKFRATDGRDLRVPVGDYSDPHHSRCYRAYRMNREIQSHGSMAVAR